MKRLLPTFFLFLFSNFTFSQNWAVINLSDKFNYKLDNDNIITATIWVDSSEWNGTDSVYYLNRIMCDTCVTITGGPNPCDTCYAAKNRPQFFQRKLSISQNGVVNFLDTGNLVFNTLANLNDSWLFDSAWNVSATVNSIGMDSVFGNFDSVKTILLSSGDTIMLSQNFGILQFPRGYGQNSYYRLVGIEGRNLGEHVPKFADYFDFNVGDIFEYHRNTASGGTCQITEGVYKYTIAGKSVLQDSIQYDIQGLSHLHEHWDVGFPCQNYQNDIYNVINQTITFIDSALHFVNKFNNSVVVNKSIVKTLYGTGSYSLPFYGEDFGPVIILYDTNNRVTKSYNQFTDYNTFHAIGYIPVDSSTKDTLNPCVSCMDNFSGTFTTGLGQTAFYYSNGFYLEREYLSAYWKGNDTIGILTPDSLLMMGLSQIYFNGQILISPNPASSTLIISFPLQVKVEFSMNDIQGKILVAKSINNSSAELDVSHIEPGIYFITIKSSAGIFSRQVLIQH